MAAQQLAEVILVDENDQVLGQAEKLKAHQDGTLHRAFSVFVFRRQPAGLELLLQQRAHDKYHCGGLWTNTCCSHPAPGEETVAAGERRIQEELGFHVPLKHVGAFQYIAHFDNGLTEHEYDHVLVAEVEDCDIKANPDEVADFRWVDIDEIDQAMAEQPEKYTPWFTPALKIALDYINQS